MGHHHFFTTVKDIATFVAAFSATIVAWLGLGLWREQLSGRTDYKLARRFLCAAYKVRDAIHHIRVPFISLGEMDEAARENEVKTGERDNRGSSKTEVIELVYMKRWERLYSSLSDLDSELLEAEISWGRKAVESQKPLRSCVSKLRMELKLYIDSRKNPESVNHLTAEERIAMAATIYDPYTIYDYEDPEGNPFNKEIRLAIEGIESFLRPYLKLK